MADRDRRLLMAAIVRSWHCHAFAVSAHLLATFKFGWSQVRIRERANHCWGNQRQQDCEHQNELAQNLHVDDRIILPLLKGYQNDWRERLYNPKGDQAHLTADDASAALMRPDICCIMRREMLDDADDRKRTERDDSLSWDGFRHARPCLVDWRAIRLSPLLMQPRSLELRPGKVSPGTSAFYRARRTFFRASTLLC